MDENARYIILVASSSLDLERRVNQYGATGDWVPQGGVAVMGYGPGAPEYLQAMVRAKRSVPRGSGE